MAIRLKARGTTRRSTVRSTRTLLSFAVAAGLTVHATAVAAPSDSESSESSESGDSSATAESFLADLVGEVSSAEGAVSSMENELGGLRESVNKARVDVDRAQREAQEAQDNVTDARGRLDTSNSDVEEAQDQLDEIARSAYARGGDAAPVNLAAGGDVAADSLDRATYLRLASEEQQSEIDRLDLVRTQTANEESSLRESRDTADGKVGAARDAHAAAEEAYSSAQSSIAEKSSELEGLRSDLAAAQARLEAAKGAVDRVSSNDGASSFDKRRAAERAADRAEARFEGEGQAQDDSGSSPAETKVEEFDTTAEGTEGTEGAEGAEAADATAEATDPAATEGTDTAEVAEGAEGAEGDAATEAPEDTEATGETGEEEVSADPNAESELPEDSSAEGSADSADSAGSEGSAGSVESSFSPDEAGDDRRQAAIDGLVNAAGEATFAGINAHLEGNPEGAAEAAANAAQTAANDSYTNLPSDEGADQGGDGSGIIPSLPGSEGSEGAPGAEPADPDTSGTVDEKIERVIDRGMGVLGTPYSWGGGDANGPTLGVRDGGVADTHGDYAKVGFDCSGLMVYAFAAVGIELEKYSGYQYTSGGTQVPVGEAKRGDMLFWGSEGTSHVALYLGDGQMLEAPNSGDVVKVSEVRWDGIQPMAVRPIE